MADFSPIRDLGLFQQYRPTPDFQSTGERPAHAAIVGAIYFAEVDMQFDDTRAARVHRKEEARSRKAKTESEFSPGRLIFVTEKGNPFATFGGVVDGNYKRRQSDHAY